MKIARTIQSVRKIINAARKAGKKIGFVPTMGALHQGHVSLIEKSIKQGNFTAVSIFVNPAQFGPNEDLKKYPRPLKADINICKEHKVDIVFVPSPEEMYGAGNLTWVNIEKLSGPLCGQFRPGHFKGVATVCAKLFNIISPDISYFGQKDAQQAIIIKQMVSDLNFPLKIAVCPTIRESNGLALSSRNQYLSALEKKEAGSIYQSLVTARQMIKAGVKNPKTIISKIRKIISNSKSLKSIDYISIVDLKTLEDVSHIGSSVLIAIAARFGKTRLIDNLVVDAKKL
jgi:pantoate--beta-alanine ligase